MSLHGSMGRSLTLLGVQWSKVLREDGPLEQDSDPYYPGWNFTVILPFFDVNVDYAGQLRHNLLKLPYMYLGYGGFAGFHISLDKNFNNGTKTYSGDAEMFEPILKEDAAFVVTGF